MRELFTALMSPPTSILAAFALVHSVLAAGGPKPPRPDPYADPENDPYNPLRYIADNTLTAIAVALIATVGIVQAACAIKYRTKTMLAMTIGCFTFMIGLALRFGLHSQPQSKGIYIAEYLFVVLSPCAFIASEYVLMGRLARHLDASRHLLVNPKRITAIFVGSDVTTFLIQAVGGSVSLSSNAQDINLIGSRVFLAGLALQLLSFSLFTVVLGVFLFRVRSQEPEIWAQDKTKKWYRDWRALACIMAISCIGILIRSIFRVVELSEGYQGPLVRSEPLFYGLDTLPLFVAVAAYLPPFFPGQYFTTERRLEKEDSAGSAISN